MNSIETGKLKKINNLYNYFYKNFYCDHEKYVKEPLNGSATFYRYRCIKCGKIKEQK